MTAQQSTVDAANNMPAEITTGQIWDDRLLHDKPRHRMPARIQHRSRRVALVATLTLALLGASNAVGKQEDPPASPSLVTVAAAPLVLVPVADELAELRAAARATRAAPAVVAPVRKPARSPGAHRAATAQKPAPVARAEVVVRFALAQVGDPYRWAAAGPNAYDCSGLVLAAYARIGVRLPHFTGTMIRYGTRVPRSQLRRGDIVFPTAGHVGIALGNGLVVHASSSKGRVVVGPLYSFYAARRLT